MPVCGPVTYTSDNHGDGMLRSPFRKELSSRLQKEHPELTGYEPRALPAPLQLEPQPRPECGRSAQASQQAPIRDPPHQHASWAPGLRTSQICRTVLVLPAQSCSHHLLPFTPITHCLTLKNPSCTSTSQHLFPGGPNWRNKFFYSSLK